jgi:hypothetical protein
MLRSKPFLTYFLICAVPLLLLAGLNYWNGTRSVHNTVNAIVQEDLQLYTGDVDRWLEAQGRALLRLAVNTDVQRVAGDPSLRKSVDASLKSAWDFGLFKSLALFDRNRQPLWFSTNTKQWEIWGADVDSAVRSHLPQPDDRVWRGQGNVVFDRQIEQGLDAGLEISVPIHNENGLGNEGAIAAVVDLKKLFSAPSRALESNYSRNTSAPLIVVRDRSGKVIYESDSYASSMSNATASGPIPRLNVTITATRDTSEFTSTARRWAIAGFVLALLLAAMAAFLLDQLVRNRSRGIARVTEDLSAIAKGELDRRIVLQSSDDARGLADNINVMTAQMRAQIAREEESRQFESFIRISAMLTHDL